MPKLTVMTPSHKLWPQFYARLLGPEGCNFRQVKAEDGIKNSWSCGDDYTKARQILESMPNIDVEGSLKYFKKHGARCDCQIIINIG